MFDPLVDNLVLVNEFCIEVFIELKKKIEEAFIKFSKTKGGDYGKIMSSVTDGIKSTIKDSIGSVKDKIMESINSTKLDEFGPVLGKTIDCFHDGLALFGGK